MIHFYFSPIGVQSISIAIRFSYVCLSIRLFVCLSARISRKPHIQVSQNFLHTLPVTVARSFSDGNAMRYVLPVLWMTHVFT